MSESTMGPREAALDDLRKRLQQRVLNVDLPIGDLTADEVWRALKCWLREAHQEERLMTPPDQIHQYVPKPVRTGDEVKIYGGCIGERKDKKDFERSPTSARLIRDDGAWLHFSLTLKCDKHGRVLELPEYNFELVFPEGHQPKFVRFDLNREDHENDARWIRCHMHPGNDDLQVPAPFMGPEELLDVLLRRMRPRDASQSRA